MSDASDTIAELKRISRLLALLVTRDAGTQRQKIEILDGAGLTPREIADLLGTTPNTVSVALSIVRKERESGSKPRLSRAAKRAATTGEASTKRS